MASQAAANRASDAASRGKIQPQNPVSARSREARTNAPLARLCSFSPHFFNKKNTTIAVFCFIFLICHSHCPLQQ